MNTELRVLSAGSLRHAFPAIIEAFSRETGRTAALSLGPAGLLRERIEAGEAFDLFASANMAHPLRLAEIGMVEQPICFATNRLCAVTRSDLGMTAENFVEVLADPAVKIGTSTPGDDPSGDYAFERFDLIEAMHHGVGAKLKKRARQLVGGRNSPVAPGGVGAFVAGGQVDLMMYYYSNARLVEDDPSFRIVEIPPAYSPTIEYGMSLSLTAGPEARRLREFVLSDSARAILADAGFSLP
jgi:molybdate transport system substrate-binding protein